MLISLESTLISELLAYESGIDARLFNWYREHFHTTCIDAPEVTRPGVCKRDENTGAIKWKRMTVEEYFRALGVLDLFDIDYAESLVPMQYRSVNALGFFGFQFGEKALRDLGVYQPLSVPVTINDSQVIVERIYAGEVPVHTWARGKREALWRPHGSLDWIVATDVNRWEGVFSGRFGIWEYADCLDPATETRLVLELMRENACVLERHLAAEGVELRSRMRSLGVDWPGILAAAHLRGAVAVANYLLWGTESPDEFGTTISQYLSRFVALDISPAIPDFHALIEDPS